MAGEELLQRFDMKQRLRSTGKKRCQLSCQTCALYTFILSIFLVVISNVVSYTALTKKPGFLRGYMRNLSIMDSSYIFNSSSTNGIGWMLPAIMSKTRNVPNVHDNGDFKENATHRYDVVNETKRTYHKTSKQETVFMYGSLDFRKTHFMTVQGNGRLGNQMFQFAALLGVSALHNYSPFVAPHHKLMQIFDLVQARVISVTNVQGHGEERAGAFDTRIQNLSHSKNWTLQGYYQSWRYFDHVANDVRKAFRFKADLYQKAFTKLKALNASITVGVHIRRGDMNTKRELARGYNVADESFIKKAFSYFRFRFKNPIFVLIGDDANWMRSRVNYNDVRIATSGNAGADLALMAQCNHSIVTSGTYGWWGAFLAGGETVYFRDYPKPGSWLDKQYKREDYYPPKWIGMS